ncbi:MAG: hypothetical protein GC154_01620 [bacterium]|nr:hypothetical protein [bacterium]
MKLNSWTTRALAAAALCAIAIQATGAAEVNVEKTSFEGWNNCYRIANGNVELVACADIGPRVLHLSLKGRDNLFSLSESTRGKTSGDQWNGYGGHRFWIAPEKTDFTYYPDNDPVRVETGENSVTMISAPEFKDWSMRGQFSVDERFDKLNDPAFRKNFTIQKTMKVSMDASGEVEVVHTAVNVGEETYDIAPWALTVMRQNGTTIIPNAPYAPHGPDHFLPVRQVILWSYTRLNDPRLTFLEKYTLLKQDPDARHPLKIGFSNTEGWVAYTLGDQLFVKYLDPRDDAEYPDMNASIELFTNSGIMEIESLGANYQLKPGQAMSHRERWRVYDAGSFHLTEKEIDRVVQTTKLDQ